MPLFSVFSLRKADRLVIHRLQRVNHSPGPGPPPAERHSPGNAVTSMVSEDFIHPAVTDTDVSREVGLESVLSTHIGITRINVLNLSFVPYSCPRHSHLHL